MIVVKLEGLGVSAGGASGDAIELDITSETVGEAYGNEAEVKGKARALFRQRDDAGGPEARLELLAICAANLAFRSIIELEPPFVRVSPQTRLLCGEACIFGATRFIAAGAAQRKKTEGKTGVHSEHVRHGYLQKRTNRHRWESSAEAGDTGARIENALGHRWSEFTQRWQLIPDLDAMYDALGKKNEVALRQNLWA
jgi:hypothetical protein